MHLRKQLYILPGLIFLLALAVAPLVRADAQNQATKLTFNEPIEIPGHTILAAGSYWFVTPPDAPGQNVVRIFNADRTKIIATLATIETDRATPAPQTEIRVAKQGKKPDALVSWFYPDREIGHEFVYGKSEEKQINSDQQVNLMVRNSTRAYGD